MPQEFTSFFRRHTDIIIQAWVDQVYADRRTHLPTLLSYSELVGQLPDLLDELARVLDAKASDVEIAEAAERLRFYAQVRFQQNCLIDEVARELMILRNALIDFMWRDGGNVTEVETQQLNNAVRRVNVFMDEMIAQTVLIYAASLRPHVPTRALAWPPRRCKIEPSSRREPQQ